MKKYLKIGLSLLNISAKRYLENRVNTFGSILATWVGLLIYILFIDAIFMHTPSLNGWAKSEAIFLLGVSRLFLALFSTFVQRSLNFLPRFIQEGNLDMILTKPAKSQFLVSLRLTRPFNILEALSGLAVCFYALNTSNYSISLINILFLILGLIMGYLILYSLYMMIATLSFWISPFNSIATVFGLATQPLPLPTNIYGKAVSFFITFIIPLGLMVTLPVQFFYGKTPYYLILISAIFAFCLLYLSAKFWNFGLKHYTSASS